MSCQGIGKEERKEKGKERIELVARLVSSLRPNDPRISSGAGTKDGKRGGRGDISSVRKRKRKRENALAMHRRSLKRLEDVVKNESESNKEDAPTFTTTL